MEQNQSQIHPETIGCDAEANEHPRIKCLYCILIGIGGLTGILLSIGAYLCFMPTKVSTSSENNEPPNEQPNEEPIITEQSDQTIQDKRILNDYTTQYNKKGQMIHRVKWENNKRHGIEEHWYETGQLSNRCYWSNNMKNGLDQYWHPNGQLAYEANWVNDELQGTPSQWDENGKVIPQPETLTLDLYNDIKLELVLIPAGKLTIPDSKNCQTYDLEITQPFYIGKYEVTEEQYNKVVGLDYRQRSKLPIEETYYPNTMIFCQKLSMLTGMTISIPSKTQWEYACRAGSNSRWFFGDDLDQGDDYFTYGMCGLRPIGQKRPNKFGLYDMHGNACERCSDWHDYYKYPNDKLQCKGREFDHLGCWFEEPINSQTAVQYHANDVVLSYLPERLGFRIVVARQDK